MRLFKGHQRIRIYLKKKGRCAICSSLLQLDSWEADHIIPWSRGGPTEVWNGQPLCATCHALKMTQHPFELYLPNSISLREWQRDFCAKFLRYSETQILLSAEARKAFILNAFPASGKTFAQLTCAKYLLGTGLCNFLVILVPSDKLRSDFVGEAQKFGIHLYGKTQMRPNFSFHQGVVLTYQQLSSEANVSLVRLWVGSHDTFVSADEIHHLSENNTWGDNFELAFAESKVRLLTTGTPFRSDNSRIPWCHYHRVSEHLEELDLDGDSSYSYGYSDALADGNVREVVFPIWKGRVRWKTTDSSGNIEEYDHTFADRLEDFYPELTPQQVEQLANQRNASAIDAETQYIRDQIKDADTELLQIRQMHPWAGGLIVCQFRDHANRVAEIVREITGEDPVLVHGDIDRAKDQLKSFQKDTSSRRSRWLVTVQMVTEGVDIKHLRVLIYATNKTAPLFWTQVLGRILRYEKEAPLEQTAVFYQYGDERLVEYAMRIEEAIQTFRRLEDKTQTSSTSREKSERQLKQTDVISAEGEGDKRVFGGESFEESQIRSVQEAARQINMDPTKLFALLQAAGGVDFWENQYKALDELNQRKREDNHDSTPDTLSNDGDL